ncbi:hypothetical protein [Sphingopyxis soli]|uniref:hypothetical protein n=1 Tax=Sphingopyxis soli TaxID=592051 RepID=UPI001BFD3B14|nr:hypothetical protein [Sphingopyxis soli]
MTRIERLETTPKPTPPSNNPFLHYPAVPAFIALFHLVDQRSSAGAMRSAILTAQKGGAQG